MLTLIQILDVQLNDVADGTVEHIETRRFFDKRGRFCDIDQIKNRCKDFIHTLNVLYPRVELRVNVEDSCHVVVAISLALFLLVRQEFLVAVFVVSVDQLKFLPACAGEIRDHDIRAGCCEEGELCMSARGVFFDLLPEEIVLLQFFEPRMLLSQHQRVALKLLLRQEQLHQSFVSLAFFFDGLPP